MVAERDVGSRKYASQAQDALNTVQRHPGITLLELKKLLAEGHGHSADSMGSMLSHMLRRGFFGHRKTNFEGCSTYNLYPKGMDIPGVHDRAQLQLRASPKTKWRGRPLSGKPFARTTPKFKPAPKVVPVQPELALEAIPREPAPVSLPAPKAPPAATAATPAEPQRPPVELLIRVMVRGEITTFTMGEAKTLWDDLSVFFRNYNGPTG